MKQSAAIALFTSVVVCALATRARGSNRPPHVDLVVGGGTVAASPTSETSLSFGAQLLVGAFRFAALLAIYVVCLTLALLVAGNVLGYVSVAPSLKSVYDRAQQQSATADADVRAFETEAPAESLAPDQRLLLDTATLTVASVDYAYLTFELAGIALAAAIALGVWAVVAPTLSAFLDSVGSKASASSSNGK